MSYRKLGRTSAQRKAMLRDLTTDLIINERIETTEGSRERTSLCCRKNDYTWQARRFTRTPPSSCIHPQ